MFRVNLDTCAVDSVAILDSCKDTIWRDHHTNLPVIRKSITSTGYIRSCPFPYATPSQHGPLSYAHIPYGKFEIREKIPDLPHHTNNWGGGGGQQFEWDLDETDNDVMGAQHPGWGHAMTFGPCHGYFKISGSDTFFVSYDDTAAYSSYQPTGQPNYIIIDNVGYGVTPWGHPNGTVSPNNSGEFPLSLVNSPDTFTFYYGRWNKIPSDSVTWTVTKAPDSQWRIFHAPYYVRTGDSMLFTRDYQPAAVILTGYDSTGIFKVNKTHHCHWVDSLNTPVNKGILWLDDPIDTSDPKSYTEQYTFILPDAYAGNGDGFGYRVPAILTGADTITTDTAALNYRPYRYHTYAMEFLPNEVRILFDSVVVYRFPDRMIPPGSLYYNWVNTMGRGGINIIPGEFDADDELDNRSNGIPDQVSQITQNFFFAHLNDSTLGFWNQAAHHLIDYVKVFDVPKDVTIPNFPH